MDKTTEIIIDSPLVSILMLTYNRANFISEAILSVLAQTYTNFELIIIDDGSTDNTTDLVSGFIDQRIRYIKHDMNQGLAVRRKESLNYTQGKYLAVLDSDDVWADNNKITEQVTYLETNPNCAVIGTFINLINERGEKIGQNIYHTTDSDIRKNILVRNQFAHSSVMMRKETIDKTSGYINLAVAEDFELFLQLGRIANFANIPKFMVNYRVHEGGTSANKIRIISFVLRVIKIHQNFYPRYLQAYLKFHLYKSYLTLKYLLG